LRIPAASLEIKTVVVAAIKKPIAIVLSKFSVILEFIVVLVVLELIPSRHFFLFKF